MIDPLLVEIDEFLSQTGMGHAVFGREAMNDSVFVLDLRRGREPRRATRNRALRQMAHYRTTGKFEVKPNGQDTESERSIK